MTYSPSIPHDIDGAIAISSRYSAGTITHTYPDDMTNYVANDPKLVALFDWGHIPPAAYRVKTYANTHDPLYWSPIYGATGPAPATLPYDRTLAAFYEQLYANESNPQHLAALAAYEHTMNVLTDPFAPHIHVIRSGVALTLDPADAESYPDTFGGVYPLPAASLGVWVFETEAQFNNWIAASGGVGLAGTSEAVIGYHLFGAPAGRVSWVTQERVLLVDGFYHWTGRWLIGKTTDGVAPPSTVRDVEEGLIRPLSRAIYDVLVTEDSVTLDTESSADPQAREIAPGIISDKRRRESRATFAL